MKDGIKLCNDVIFKVIFLREKDILMKMIYDITNISETIHYEEILTGYELEPYKINGKVNKCDMLIMNPNYNLISKTTGRDINEIKEIETNM